MKISALLAKPIGNSTDLGDRASGEAALESPSFTEVTGVPPGDRASEAAARPDLFAMRSPPVESASKSKSPKLILKPGAKLMLVDEAIKLDGGTRREPLPGAPTVVDFPGSKLTRPLTSQELDGATREHTRILDRFGPPL